MGRPNRRPYPSRRPAGKANGNGEANGVSPAQQPSRPRTVAAGEVAGEVEPPGVMDPRRLYSTSAGGGEAKPFKSLGDTLDKGLLEGLDKMGFE